MAEATITKPTFRAKGSESGELALVLVAKLFNIPEASILAFKDYGAYVVCVTVNGEKLQADKHA